MDELGNYTQIEWFLSLNNFKLRKFILELYDIWFYRSQLTPNMRNNICPPHGNPFININMNNVQNFYFPHESLRNMCYIIMNVILFSSNNKDNQTMGALYILTALTIVNSEAAIAMPWLYYSVN